MANDLSSNVWVLDTQSASNIWEFMIKINTVVWVKPSTIGHLMQLADRNGKLIVDAIAEAANGSQTFRLTQWVQGLRLPDLDSGTVHIHLAP